MKAQQTNPLRISHESLDLDDIISDLNEGNIQVTSQANTNKQPTSGSQTTINDTISQTQTKSINNASNSTNKSITKELKSTTGSSQQHNNDKSKIGVNNSSAIQKTQSKSRLGLNKENTNKISNQSKSGALNNNSNVTSTASDIQSIKSTTGSQGTNNQKDKDYLISTTTDANTNSNSNVGGGVVGVGMMINDRYQGGGNTNTSEYKFDSISNMNQDDYESVRGLGVGQSNSKMSIVGNQSQVNDMPFYMNNNNSSSSNRSQPTQMHLGGADEDVESFQKKLDTLIINFRSETMQEFIKTKKQVLTEQNATIDAERRRCNTLLGVKQNEIEQLKENLGQKTKMCDELGIRCEIMALWAGKGKTLARMKVLQFKCFNALKQYKEFKKHSKQVLQHKLAEYKKQTKRKAFLGWEKHYKEWKVVKNRDDLEKAVKSELQQICAQYSKEIESLRQKLDEANAIVDQEYKNKAMMQENLKKAFMRGVCALNFEAMNILNPNDVGYQSQIEKEMEKQVMYAMNDIASQSNTTMTQRTYESNQKSPQKSMYSQPQFQQRTTIMQQPVQNIFEQQNQSYNQFNQYNHNSNDAETYQSERKFMQIDHNTDMDYKKVETKDSLWKPAPIMGNTYNNTQQQQMQQPQITQMLKQTQPQTQQNFVLPSHFTRLNQQETISNSQHQQQPGQFTSLDSYNMGSGNLNNQQYSNQPTTTAFQQLQTTDDKVLYNQQLNYQSSSLPDFISQSHNSGNNSSANQHNECKSVYVVNVNTSGLGTNLNGMTSVGQVAQTSSVGGKTINVNKTVAVNQTTKKGTVSSTTSGTAKKTTK